MENLFSIIISIATLSLMEVVLGIDNIVMLSVMTNRLPLKLRQRARLIGLALAMIMRIGLLFSISLIMKLTTPIFTLGAVIISGRSLVLLAGGLFLIFKATKEIHELVNHPQKGSHGGGGSASFKGTILQIVLMDMIFSLDSVITAIGMAKELFVMVIAVIVAIIIMMTFAKTISDFIGKHQTITHLALSFLILIGVMLVAESIGQHIEKGYIYFAMAFSIGVEMINMRHRKKSSQN